MNRQPVFVLIGFVACSLAAPALAFRSCPGADNDQFGAATQYMVGELSFDADTGLAGGTQTTYNYTSMAGEGVSECHVTYELAGNFLPVSNIFVLDATRTNYSENCTSDLIDYDYPETRSYLLQMQFAADGSSVVNMADSGEVLARGSWASGRALYKTDEQCTLL